MSAGVAEREATSAADDGPSGEAAAPAAAFRRWPYGITVAVLVIGLLVTAALTVISHDQYASTEKRLLNLRAREVGSVLAEALPATQVPLASAAALAQATNGNTAKFEQFAAPYAVTTHQFVSISLWRLSDPRRGPIAVVGTPPSIAASPGAAAAVFARARRATTLSVVERRQPSIRLGYAITAGRASRYGVYAESLLPKSRRSRLQSNSAFSDLDYAIYLGRDQRNADLLVTSLGRLPIQGRHAVRHVDFGDTVLTLVVIARQPLSGTLPERLPLIIALVGLILTLGAAWLTRRLIQRRRSAEELAVRLELAVHENQRLYAEQRTIAQTLQRALLPDDLPQVPGAQSSARYEPGERGVEVGGDWYDVIPLDDHRLLVVVGDVSGRGLPAATTMASLRFAIHAYAAQDDPPETILSKLSKLLNVGTAGHFATVLCALLDVRTRQMSVASAGHLPPLLISDGEGRYMESHVGLPIGIRDGDGYSATTFSAPPAATFLAFTDGLVERRGESLDEGLDRLRDAALADHSELPDLLSGLIEELRQPPAEDDTAIVGVRWTS